MHNLNLAPYIVKNRKNSEKTIYYSFSISGIEKISYWDHIDSYAVYITKNITKILIDYCICFRIKKDLSSIIITYSHKNQFCYYDF